MADNNDVTVLNSLIATTIDSVNGYERSAENAQNNQYQSMFREFAQDRRQVVTKLQQQVSQVGGNPEDDGSTAGALHRGWEDLTSALTGTDDKQVINEVERGEDYLKDKWETALREENLSPPTRDMLNQCYDSVKRGHDRVRDLKHRLEGTTA